MVPYVIECNPRIHSQIVVYRQVCLLFFTQDIPALQSYLVESKIATKNLEKLHLQMGTFYLLYSSQFTFIKTCGEFQGI